MYTSTLINVITTCVQQSRGSFFFMPLSYTSVKIDKTSFSIFQCTWGGRGHIIITRTNYKRNTWLSVLARNVILHLALARARSSSSLAVTSSLPPSRNPFLLLQQKVTSEGHCQRQPLKLTTECHLWRSLPKATTEGHHWRSPQLKKVTIEGKHWRSPLKVTTIEGHNWR